MKVELAKAVQNTAEQASVIRQNVNWSGIVAVDFMLEGLGEKRMRGIRLLVTKP